MTGDEVLVLVEAHLVSALGEDSGRAGVSFLGTERVDVLRFGPDADGVVRYATLGMSRAPMSGEAVLATEGPRAELLLTVRGAQDSVLRRLATLAASPAVEGVVIGPGAGLDLGEPLWDGARFTA
ncbi:MAG: suppressor of fused domain protein, partial [Mycobacteriaceae bacterium]